MIIMDAELLEIQNFLAQPPLSLWTPWGDVGESDQ